MPAPPTAHPTAETQRLGEIRDWRHGVVDPLVGYRATVQRAIRDGSVVAPRFLGMTEADVDAYYDSQRRKIDRLTVLNLVASAEPSIREDYAVRVHGKGTDPLARA